MNDFYCSKSKKNSSHVQRIKALTMRGGALYLGFWRSDFQASALRNFSQFVFTYLFLKLTIIDF